VPRGRALGLALSLPEKDTYSRTYGWLYDRIVISYGGYAAEKIVYGETTTGAAQDIKQATEIARKMVREWGMSDAIGPVSLGDEEEPIFLGREIAQHKDYSEETARKIDAAIQSLLSSALEKAMSILTREKDRLLALADRLMQIETLEDSDVRTLLGLQDGKFVEEGAVKC
jgi:cell division protease FtsH